jgi:hypothetical protein
MSLIDQTDTQFNVLDYIASVAIISLPLMLAVSMLREPTAWTDFAVILNSRTVWWTVAGAVLHQVLNLVIAHMHRLTTLMSIGVAGQVKLLGSLIISQVVYGQTEWGVVRSAGVALLAAGGALYTYTRVGGRNNREGSDTALLTEQQPDFLRDPV